MDSAELEARVLATTYRKAKKTVTNTPPNLRVSINSIVIRGCKVRTIHEARKDEYFEKNFK